MLKYDEVMPTKIYDIRNVMSVATMAQNLYTLGYTEKANNLIKRYATYIEKEINYLADVTKSKNQLIGGQNVQIAVTDPQIKVVVEEYVVEDVENKFSTIEEYSNELAIGNNQVTQYGSNGIDRVSRDIKKVNGLTTYVNTQSKVEIKPTVNQIVLIGVAFAS